MTTLAKTANTRLNAIVGVICQHRSMSDHTDMENYWELVGVRAYPAWLPNHCSASNSCGICTRRCTHIQAHADRSGQGASMQDGGSKCAHAQKTSAACLNNHGPSHSRLTRNLEAYLMPLGDTLQNLKALACKDEQESRKHKNQVELASQSTQKYSWAQHRHLHAMTLLR